MKYDPNKKYEVVYKDGTTHPVVHIQDMGVSDWPLFVIIDDGNPRWPGRLLRMDRELNVHGRYRTVREAQPYADFKIDDPVMVSDDGEMLYTEAQLIAMQQKVAEACAEYLVKGNHDDEFIASRGIIAGEWKEYL